MEAPICEGVDIANWVREGTGGDIAEIASRSMAFRMGACAEMQSQLRWMRDFNESFPTRGVHYAGIDPPQTLGSLVPALQFVLEYVSPLDPDTVGLIVPLIEIGKSYEAANLSEVVPKYQELEENSRQYLTASLSRLYSRFRALRLVFVEKTGRERYEMALRILESALCLDHFLHEMLAVWAGKGMFGEGCARDAFMAEDQRAIGTPFVG